MSCTEAAKSPIAAVESYAEATTAQIVDVTTNMEAVTSHMHPFEPARQAQAKRRRRF